MQLLVLLCATMFLAGELRAQVAGAMLSGAVTDTSGTVIPGAKLSINNVATGISVAVAANSDGLYSAPNLLPGVYQVVVTAVGFATLERAGITLTVGSQQVLNLTLRIGQVNEKVEVTGEAPSVELGSSEISANVDEKTMRDLPLNGRDWSQLATLQPGIATVRTPVSLQNNGTARGLGATLTISGNRPNQNNYRLDGISVNDYANSAPGSVLGQNLGVDAIQEFSVLSSNYSAEYGKTSGGVVNAITKSGTNQFHGTAYEFLRNSALDARNFFDGPSVPPFRRNQFGGSAGGPIKKDRAFIFGDYEGLRQSLTTTAQETVPSATARAGTLHYDPTGTVPSGCTVTVVGTCTVTVDPQVLRFVNAFFPLPNQSQVVGAGDTGLYKVARGQVVPQNYMTTKVDYNLSAKDTLFGTYLYDSSTLTQPDEFKNKIDAFQSGRQSAVLEETHIFSPLLANTLRLGYSRSRAWGGITLPGSNPAATDPSYASVPGMTAAQVTIPGVTSFSGGVGAPSNQRFVLNAYQVYDDAFLTKGNHSLKFGVAFERDQNNMLTRLFPDGQALFGSLNSFLQGQAQSFTAILQTVPVTPRDMRQSIVGTYIQDDWRFRRNLTLNLGVRYEMATVPTEVKNRLSSLLNVTDAQPHLGSPFFANPTLRNFEPRVGFAWDPFGTGKTSVRGGFGMFDVLPLTYQNWESTYAAAPFTENGTVNNYNPNTFPFQVFGPINNANTFAQEYIEPHPHRNYVEQWNLNIQRQLTSDLSIMVGYVGSHSLHNPFLNDDINIVTPTLTPQGYAWPLPIGSGTVTNQAVGQIRTYLWKSSSSFNGLETQVTKKISHGVQVQGSFTWSKTIDTSSASRTEDQFNNSYTALPFWDNRLNRGLADFNVGKNVVINFTWEIPAPKLSWSVADWIASGWQLGGVFEASSGVPFYMSLGGDTLGQNNSDPFNVPNRLGGPGCASLVNPGNPISYVKIQQCLAFPNPVNIRGNLGRNTMIGPGLMNSDLSVVKNFPLKLVSESFKAQFRAEFFNAFNRANFAPPLDNLTAYDGSGTLVGGAGQIDSTQTPSRQIQFGLKLAW